ncbi:MAG TPA: transcription elongation factor GreB, partial [Thalassospira lucentensis]|nr:transcription elongation factor GreB [Thalassospira lucentensis]
MDKPIYITPEGLDALRKELDHLWKKERPEVVAVVHWAAGNG